MQVVGRVALGLGNFREPLRQADQVLKAAAGQDLLQTVFGLAPQR